ncbi:MAG: Tn3 family transposase, partial [Nitrospirae bacterium]|nr:Tn3 family transposase [Nitrospirota bacterium]
KEVQAFDNPPEFNGEERKKVFFVPFLGRTAMTGFRTPINKVGFVLQCGYFSAVNKFFVASRFHRKDVEFTIGRLDLSMEEVNLSDYNKRTRERHQEIILKNLGWRKFDEDTKMLLIQEALTLCSKQTKPRLMFLSLVDFLRRKKIELPTYYAISEIITQALNNFEETLIVLLDRNLSVEDRRMLDELLREEDEYLDGEKKVLKIKRYRLTLLKKSNQSTKPSKIKENVRDLKSLHTLFRELTPIIERLGLSSELIQYYAQIVIKSQIFQIHRREENRHLLLIAFVVHQLYQLNDILIEILMQSVQTTINSSTRENKERFYEERQSKHRMIGEISQKLTKHLGILERIEKTVQDEQLTDGEKVKAVKQFLTEDQRIEYVSLQGELEILSKESSRITKNDDYYDMLETKSIKLQNRAADIIKNIEFDEGTSNQQLIDAIRFYKNKDGIVINPPLDFLEKDEQSRVSDKQGKIRMSLYKVMLFEHVASGIKSGALNLRYSYKYRAFEDYLIPHETWAKENNELLDKAGLLAFKTFDNLKDELRKAIRVQFQTTNENIMNMHNPHVTIGTDDRMKVHTPPEDEEISDTQFELFPKDRFISLFEVLSTVNKLSRFTDTMEHWQIKYNREKPPERAFLAGIIAHGCNLGVSKIAQISRNINTNELEHTVNWYFTNENIIQANNRILEITERLQLPSIFKRAQNATHTSSDGQKFAIRVESLNANYSYKYFGKGKGVCVYSFIDESHRLFYSTVINSSEREAAYVVDGLLHNDVVQSDVHSTDTHGYSESIFAVTHLLGISFAPRIKNFREQNLYDFDSVSNMKKLGYPILPTGTIKKEIIDDVCSSDLSMISFFIVPVG